MYKGESFNAGIFWFNQNTFSTPDVIPPHKHDIPHTTIIKFGTFKITLDYPDGRKEEHICTAADHPIHVPAGVEHTIECTEAPGRSECLFLHYDPITSKPTDRFMGVRFQKPIS